MKIIEDYQQFDKNVVKIDAWYDWHTRDYCIQLLKKTAIKSEIQLESETKKIKIER